MSVQELIIRAKVMRDDMTSQRQKDLVTDMIQVLRGSPLANGLVGLDFEFKTAPYVGGLDAIAKDFIAKYKLPPMSIFGRAQPMKDEHTGRYVLRIEISGLPE